MGIADIFGDRDQLVGDDALAPPEFPVRTAPAQLLGGCGASSCSIWSKSDSIWAVAPGDSMARLDR
jgi:hypothetical protein